MVQKVINKTKVFLGNHSILKRTIVFSLLFLFILISYELFYETTKNATDNLQTIRTLMIIAPILSFGYGCYLKGKNKLDINKLCLLLMICGFSLRIGYAFYTGVNCRQHDVEMGTFEDLNLDGHGHFSYIYTIFSTGKLPETIEWQFYHPPLWHATVALFMKIMSVFHTSYGVGELFQESIVVASFVGCVTLIGIKDLLFTLLNRENNDFSLKNKHNIMIAIIFSLLAFHPQFFIMSGWMNNEGMAFMFMIFAFLYGVKFHFSRKYSDIVLCAVMLSLGATTKVSVALICIPLGIIFVYDFVSEIKQKRYNIFLKAGLFFAICIPISTWFVVRNMIKFHEPAIGVPAIDPNLSPLGVVKYNAWERFGIPNIFKGISESIFCILTPNKNGYMDYNVWLYTFKCSVFGEYNYWQGDLFACCLLFFNILIICFSILSMIFVSIKRRKEKGYEKFLDILMFVIFAMSLLSYICFQILYPVTCTQDFRYMTLILIPCAYYLGKCYVLLDDLKIQKVLKKILLIAIIGFIASAFLYYISCR